MDALKKSHDDGRLGAAAWRILAILPFLSIRETLRTLLLQDGTESHRNCAAADN